MNKYYIISRKLKQLVIKKKKYIKFRKRSKRFKFLENKKSKNSKKNECRRKRTKVIRLKFFSKLNLIRLKNFKLKKKYKKRIPQFIWNKHFITKKINSKLEVMLNKRKNLLSRLEKNKYNYF